MNDWVFVVCFFFKQKTAYEMRISDWSSDVCSSDLAPLVDVAGRLMGPAGALALGLGVVFSVGGGSLTSLLTAPRLTFALSRDGSLPAWFEIGRASCRERVCQYV